MSSRIFRLTPCALSALLLGACAGDLVEGELAEPALEAQSLALAGDSDSDGVLDSADNCPFMWNPTQANGNGIGPGDACELALNFGTSMSTTFAQARTSAQVFTQVAIAFQPFALTNQISLMSSLAGNGSSSYYSPSARKLGVRSSSEWFSGQDTIAPGEQITFSRGSDGPLGRFNAVWLRVRGDGLADGQLRVRFISGITTVGETTITAPRSGGLVRVPVSGTFNNVEIKGVSRNNSLYATSARPEAVLFELACKEGLREVDAPSGKLCADINECTELPGRCGEGGTCTNGSGGFYCVCGTGYIKQNDVCVDFDECTRPDLFCGVGQPCTNLPGSYLCE